MKKRKRIVLSICMIVVWMVSIAGCGKERSQGKEKELVVLTDYGLDTAAKMAADYFMEKNPDVKMRIETISNSNADAHSAEIKKWNTKMMEGEGPDVYLFSTYYEHITVEEGMEELLIKNVDKTMQSGVFAPLDTYMEEDSFWKESDYNKKILEAGKHNQKQYVLPLTCQYFLLTGEDESFLNVQTIEELLKSAVNPHTLLFVGARWMQPAVDYAEGKVLFDKEKWAEFATECFKAHFEKNDNEEGTALWNIDNTDALSMIESKNGKALPNLNGDRIAAVKEYGAVGMSSDYKKEAYEFLRLFLNDEYEKEKGQPILTDKVSWEENPFVLSSYKELDGAYFPLDVERFIYEEIEKIAFETAEMPADLEEQCKNLSEKIYEKYKMIAEE